ncbi:MAG TPA: flavodoxin domain-containing protein [Solirubrobacteraceae bacterium]|jgi:menaquinone-dependent protoporphyrinogen IX oxidase|nr:flavodoxin domain-containing protein [Solirubrobacteraceae bacterium]
MSQHPAATQLIFRDADALVVYTGTERDSATVAMRIASAMRAQGLEVDLRDVTHASAVKPDGYGLVVVGAPRSGRKIAAWARERRAALERVPSMLFSVWHTAAEDSDAVAQQSIAEFCAETGWTPNRIELIAA